MAQNRSTHLKMQLVRLENELQALRTSGIRALRSVTVDESNILQWQGLILPENAPYNKGAFKIEINFPAKYPFGPPRIIFKTKIYHPNINESGEPYLPLICVYQYKPAVKMPAVIQQLVDFLNDPKPEYPYRPDLAREYAEDREKFFEKAEEFTLKHSEERPVD